MASTVSPIDPEQQLQAEMRSLGYVEGLFIYTIIHVNKLPSQACSSISEFFCFVGLMEIFSPATWRPVLGAICGGGGGGEEPQRTRYIDYCTWAYALRAYAVSARLFCHPSLETFFFFFLGPVFFLVFNHGLFSFLYFAIHDTQNEQKRKLGVNKSQVANVNKRKRGDMK